MSKGAPKGNQNARKVEADRGINVSLYLGSRELETLQLSIKYDGKEPTREAVRAKVRKLAQDAISREVRKTFARYAAEWQKEDAMNQENAERMGRAEQEILDKGKE